jgi:hypothetical protein
MEGVSSFGYDLIGDVMVGHRSVFLGGCVILCGADEKDECVADDARRTSARE